MQLVIERDIVINQSVDRLWEILATEYVNIDQWASAIAASRADASVTRQVEAAPVGGRICTAPGYGDVKEVITSFDEENKSYSYRGSASAMPRFVTDLLNHWSLHPLESNKTIVRSRAIIEMKSFPGFLAAPFMRVQFGRMGKVFADELTYYAETGQIAATKLKALEKENKSRQTGR